MSLRCALGLPPLDRPPTDDIPAHLPADLEVEGLHSRWWIAWCVAGLDLFSRGELPTMAAAIIAAKRTVAAIAMDAHYGRLSVVARMLSTGPKNVRRTLEEAGTWPWVESFYRHPPTDPISWCRCAAEHEDAEAHEAEAYAAE
ncbi:MAG: hypothetical protein AB1Z98_39585 [Nannocystaceae bacterium]